MVLLRPLEVGPWFSGVDTIFVARADRMPKASSLVYAPGHLSLKQVEDLAGKTRDVNEYREALGGREFDDALAHGLARIEALTGEHDQVETLARPLRRRLQTADIETRREIRGRMREAGIDEADLCAAWHHLPAGRRRYLAVCLEQWARRDGAGR